MTNGDAFYLTQAQLASPDTVDVRAWPIITSIESVTFNANPHAYEAGNTMLEFAGRDSWPIVKNMENGDIRYTVWMGCLINGQWVIAAICQGINQYVPTGPILDPGQVPKNLFYYCNEPLQSYQPAAGEQVAFFVTTGVTRRYNVQSQMTAGRSNVVLVPFSVGWHDTVAAPMQPPVSTPPPVVTPPVVTPPTPPTPVPYDELLRRLSELEAQMQDRFDQLDRRVAVLASQPIPHVEIPPFPSYIGSVFGARIRLTPEK